MEQYSGPTTTANSESEGRMKVDAGSVCKHGKKKCLKCAMGKYKDGKGGPKLSFPIGSGGFGATPAQKTVNITRAAIPGKKKKLSIPASLKAKKGKDIKFSKKSVSSIMKKMKLGKKTKAPKRAKVKSLKAILRGGK